MHLPIARVALKPLLLCAKQQKACHMAQTLGVPPASREKYPGWTVAYTKRRKPLRRSAKAKVDDDGMREYSVFECVHGCGEKLYVLTASLANHKNGAIDDHLSFCPEISVDDRPAKKQRGGISVRALADPKNEALLAPLHVKCKEEIDQINARLHALEQDNQVFHMCVEKILPSMRLPLVPDLAIVQFKSAIDTDIVQKLPAAVTTGMVHVERPLETNEHTRLMQENARLQLENGRLRRERDAIETRWKEALKSLENPKCKPARPGSPEHRGSPLRHAVSYESLQRYS